MNLNLQGLSNTSVAITDHRMVAANLARVIVTYTGKQTRESLTAAVSAALDHQGAAVENSFRSLRPGVAVGYVRANTQVRVVENDMELRANYKAMLTASDANIMMDNRDRTLWELKTGAGGKFLARHGHEDLSELIEASTISRQDIPRINQLSVNAAARREFVAFASASGEMDYGFCIGYSEAKKALRVVSASSREPVIIPEAAVASIVQAKIPAATHQHLTNAGISRKDAKEEEKYYKELYGYDPEYMNEVIRQVNDTATF